MSGGKAHPRASFENLELHLGPGLTGHCNVRVMGVTFCALAETTSHAILSIVDWTSGALLGVRISIFLAYIETSGLYSCGIGPCI